MTVLPVLALTMFAFLFAVPPVPVAAQTARYVPGEIIVRFKSNLRKTEVRNFGNRHQFKGLRRFPAIGAAAFALPPETDVRKALTAVRRDPEVLYAEPNYYRYALETIPDDSFFNQLWGLKNTGQVVNNTAGLFNADIDAPEAWDVSTGNEPVIAVIDSGIDFHHPDLKVNLWTNPKEIPDNGFDDDGNGYIDDIHGWNFTGYDPPGARGDANIIDSNHHGTHVSGIIAARGDNGTGTVGVCWKARIMTLKFLDAYGEGSVTDEIAAIEYAVQNGARIINASFGDYQASEAEAEAIARAERAGVLFVCAAGNYGKNNDREPLYPASYRSGNILSVAASDQQDNLPEWSNYGNVSVDIAAPGVNIYAPQPGREDFWKETFDRDINGSWTLTPPWSHLWPTANRNTVHSGNGSLTNTLETGDGNFFPGTAASPAVNLTGCVNNRLVFYLKRRSVQGKDRLFVETATNVEGPWSKRAVEILIPHLGTSVVYENGVDGDFIDWREAMVDITNLDDARTAYFRFRISADGGLTEGIDGWYIDDPVISVSATSYNGPETDYYRYLNGTSAAAPFVSGVAALVWSCYPELSYCQVKNAILNSGDFRPGLDGRISSGRRLNAMKSLALAADPLSLPVSCGDGAPGNSVDGDSDAPCWIGSMGISDSGKQAVLTDRRGSDSHRNPR